MGYKIAVYMLAIGAVFLMTSPTKGTYLRHFEDRYEGKPWFLEFPRDTDEYIMMQKRDYNAINGSDTPPNRHPAAKREEKFPDEPIFDELKQPLYLPVAVIMAKDFK